MWIKKLRVKSSHIQYQIKYAGLHRNEIIVLNNLKTSTKMVDFRFKF